MTTRPKYRTLKPQWAIATEKDEVVTLCPSRAHARQEMQYYRTIIGKKYRVCKVRVQEVLA